MSTLQAKPPAVDAKLIVPFVNSVRHVLRSTAGWESTVDRPYVKQANGPEYDYSGIISFSGSIIGSVVVSFRGELATQLVKAFVGIDIEPNSPDFADAIGELTNMIVGAAKVELAVNATISVPSVVMGRGHVIARRSDIPCIVVPCKTTAGEFAVEVSIKSAA